MGNTLDSCSGIDPMHDDDEDINASWLANTSSFVRSSQAESFGRMPSYRPPMEITGRAPSYLASASPLHKQVANGIIDEKHENLTKKQPEFDKLISVLKNRTPFSRLDENQIRLAALRFEYVEFADGDTVVDKYSGKNQDPWQWYTVLIEGAFEQQSPGGATRLTKGLKTIESNDNSPDILGEVEIVHRQTKCDEKWVARLDVGAAATGSRDEPSTDVDASTPARSSAATGADGRKKTRNDSRSDRMVRAYRMSARDFRGVFRVVIQEIENDEESRRDLEIKTKLLKGVKVPSPVYKLCELLKTGIDGEHQLAMACVLLKGTAGERLAETNHPSPEGNNGGTISDPGMKDGGLVDSKSAEIKEESKGDDSEDLYLVMAGACSLGKRSFQAGQFFTSKPESGVYAEDSENGDSCQVLKLGQVEVGMFFGGEKPHDMLKKSEYVTALEDMLDHIYSPEEQAKRIEARPWETLFGYKSKGEIATRGGDETLNKKARALALKSCNFKDLSMIQRRRGSWRRRRDLVGVLSFGKGTTVFKNGQLNDIDQVKKGFRSLCGKSFATFIVLSGKLRVESFDGDTVNPVKETDEGEHKNQNQPQSQTIAEKEPRFIRHVGPNEYVSVNPHKDSPEYGANVVAENDTTVFVLRLLDKDSHSVKPSTGLGAKLADLGWCCGPRDMREYGLAKEKRVKEHQLRGSTVPLMSGIGDGSDQLPLENLKLNHEMNIIKSTWGALHAFDAHSTIHHTNAITSDSVVNQVWEGLAESDSPIGKGMLGNVFCVRPKDPDLQSRIGLKGELSWAVFAAKVMRKEDVINKRQTNAVLRELRAMSDPDIQHPFIVNMFCTWQTDTKLVMLLEYMDGGELHLLGRSPKKGWPSLDAFAVRFYSACVLSALTHIHETLGCVYRDLKGENVMIDRQGYAKLVDFGFCKKLRLEPGALWGRTSTVCGTPEYMAPEIIGSHEKYRNTRYAVREGYGPSVDFWALGVLIYERVYKYSPFSSRGKYSKFPQLFANIMDDRYLVANGPPTEQWPDGEPGRMCRLLDHDPDCYDIIDALLTRDVSRRLGNETRFTSGGREIMEHPFFAGSEEASQRGFPCIDFEALERRSLRGVPWTPKISEDASSEDWSHGLKKFMRRRVKKHEIGSPRTAEELACLCEDCEEDVSGANCKQTSKCYDRVHLFENWAMVHPSMISQDYEA